MKRAFGIAALATLCGVSLPAPAGAQALSGLRVGWGGVDLLSNPIVRDELKLDEAQAARVKALSSEIHARQKDLIASLEGLAGDERREKARELAGVLEREERKALAGLLRPGQLARFGQVELQQRGASALVDPGVARSLGLTAEQSEQLRKLLDQSVTQRREAQSNTRGNRRATTEKLEALRKEADARALGLLGPGQREAWTKMTGEPVDLSPITRAGR